MARMKNKVKKKKKSLKSCAQKDYIYIYNKETLGTKKQSFL